MSRSDEANEKPQQDGTAATNGEAESQDKQEQESQQQQQPQDDSQAKPKNDSPSGGFSSTPIPPPPSGTVGYTLKITFHRATNLAMGDAHTFSSDPYILAQLNSYIPTRHKEDPPVRFRTPTTRRETDPKWDEEWIVANVPSSGFRLKVRIYDEDPADHDDLLGKIHVDVPSLSDGWEGIRDQRYRVQVKQASKRALIIRTLATCFRRVEHMTGELYISIEMLGRTGDDGQNCRLYTAGPCRWFRHYSPILGRLANIKEPNQQPQAQPQHHDGGVDGQHQQNNQVEHYNFQANQFQLQGPVPPQLYHRFVEFKPWVGSMFTTKGLQGIVLGKALHHQHTRVYNFGKSTITGSFPQGPSTAMTEQFLDLVHWDKGGRIYTYVITLDALWRFTETGKEFGIDMLSKHTMHSDVSIYIAFSGEFFIRRLKHKDRPPPPQPAEPSSQQPQPDDHRHNEDVLPSADTHDDDDELPKDPAYYELVIDNDSGTYRPNAAMLPVLASFLSHSLPGLHILTLDCQADADRMGRMKGEQRERKKKEGGNVVYTQDSSDDSSISSSEDEALEAREQAMGGNGNDVSQGDGGGNESGALSAAAKDAKRRQQGRMSKVRRNYGRKGRGDGDEDEDVQAGGA